MALIYTTGTINQPDAGSVGQAMVEKIRDDVVAHAAWELVEEFTPGGGAVRWYVFKCLAASSGLPADFFVVIGRTLSNGELRFVIGEGYNSGSHTLSFFAQNSGAINFDSEGRNPATMTLGTTVWTTTGAHPKALNWVPSGTSTKWWIIAADDGFTVAFNGPSNGFVHINAYTQLTELAISMPIGIVGSGDSSGALTRNPAVAGANFQNYALHVEGGGASSVGTYGPLLGFAGELRYNDKLQNNQRPMAEIGMVIYISGAMDQIAQCGRALGKQKRMRGTQAQAPVGFAFGDAYAMDGKLWVPYLPTDGRVWDTGVASS